MKVNLKTISMILVAIMLVSLFQISPMVGATETEGLLVREEGLLLGLGIVDEDTDYNKAITRAELAQLLARVCNIDLGTSSNATSPFYDVNADSQYFASICAMYDRGVLSGDGNGFFRPDDTVTYSELCKVFSVILGYKVKGEFTSYTKTANESGITVGLDGDEPIRWCTAAKMAYNVLHTPMMEQKTFGDQADFVVDENYLAIENYHKLKSLQGIVSGMYGTTLTDADSTLSENEVIIGGKTYTSPQGKSYFGKHVIYYIPSDLPEGSRAEIKYMFESEKNHTLMLEAKELGGKKGENITYFSGSKEKKAIFVSGGDVIINGVAYPEYTDIDFSPASGSVTLIDNNDDQKYDVAIIESYAYMVIGGVDVENTIIYDKNDTTNVLGSKDKTKVDLRIYKGDIEAYPSTLKEDMVVAIRKSPNTNGKVLIKVTLPDQAVEGYVTSVFEDSFVLDGQEYMLEDNAIADANITAGSVATISVFGNRVGALRYAVGDGYVYGYLVDAVNRESAFSGKLKVKLITGAKKEMEYDCAEKLMVDESVYDDPNRILSHLENAASQTQRNAKWPRAQMIRYKLNQDGVMTHIDTLIYNPATETEESLRLDISHSGLRYYQSSRNFYTNDSNIDFVVSLPGIENVWSIPKDQRDEEPHYSNAFGDKGVYPVEAYNVDEFSKVAKILIGYNTVGTSVSASAEPRIVTAVEQTLNEYGEVIKQITVVGANATPTTYRFRSDLVFDVSPGDVVRLNRDGKGEILFIEKVFSPDVIPGEGQREVSSGTGSSGNPEFEATMRTVYGSAVAIKDGRISHTTSISDDIGGAGNYLNLHSYILPSGVPYYCYDSTVHQPKVEAASSANVITYEMNRTSPDKVILYTASGTLRFVYIIR